MNKDDIISTIIGIITGYVLSVSQNAGDDTWNYIKKKYNQFKDNYHLYKKAKNIINDYNKQKEIISKYENDIKIYNLKYNQNRLEILEQKIKETYGNDAYGLWWFFDDGQIKPNTIHDGNYMELPYIGYHEHIWKDMGELKIYKI